MILLTLSNFSIRFFWACLLILLSVSPWISRVSDVFPRNEWKQTSSAVSLQSFHRFQVFRAPAFPASKLVLSSHRPNDLMMDERAWPYIVLPPTRGNGGTGSSAKNRRCPYFFKIYYVLARVFSQRWTI